MRILAEKYKLLLVTILTLLIASSVVLAGETAIINGRVFSKPSETTETTVVTEVKGNSSVYDNGSGWANSEKVSNLPKLNYVVPFGNSYLSVNVTITSIKEPERGAYWCGSPYLLDYYGEAKASILNKSGEVEDEINLTSPTLVIGKHPNYDYYYYKTYDLDGDGNNYEFIVLDYESCNSNWVKIVRADTKTHRFVTLPFLTSGEEKDRILAGPNKDDLIFFPAQLSTKTYDMINGTFSKKEFTYKNGVFVQTSKP